jgi:hypothetical protein
MRFGHPEAAGGDCMAEWVVRRLNRALKGGEEPLHGVRAELIGVLALQLVRLALGGAALLPGLG